MDNALIERAFINLVVDMIESEALPRIRNHTDFAQICFKGEKNAVAKWKNLRLGNKVKPGSISFCDALAIADTVEKPLSELIVRAKVRVEMGWTLNDDCVNTAKKTRKDILPTTEEPLKVNAG